MGFRGQAVRQTSTNPARSSRWDSEARQARPVTRTRDGRHFTGGGEAMSMVRLGLVVARFNRSVTEPMEERAREAAADRDAEVVETTYVPGVYDTPLAADRLARREDVDAVTAVGAIVTGDTDHDKVIGDAAAQGLTDVSLSRDTPVTFGVTGPGMSADEAHARLDYGAGAVESAVDLVEGAS